MMPDEMQSFLWENVRRLSEQACTALIDQDRRIGSDPVGHACFAPATQTHWINGIGFRVCQQCADMLEREPERITFWAWKGKPGHD